MIEVFCGRLLLISPPNYNTHIINNQGIIWDIFLYSTVFWKFIRSRRSSHRAVLLVGLCDSGKTLLFVRVNALVYISPKLDRKF